MVGTFRVPHWLGGASCAVALLCAQSAPAQSQEAIARTLLVNMAKSQYTVLCQSAAFTQCMGFSSARCTELAETAIEQCLMDLPEQVNLAELNNDALEACPRQIFADAGFSEKQAAQCFDKAIKDEP